MRCHWRSRCVDISSRASCGGVGRSTGTLPPEGNGRHGGRAATRSCFSSWSYCSLLRWRPLSRSRWFSTSSVDGARVGGGAAGSTAAGAGGGAATAGASAAGASAAGAADILAAERRHIHRWLREGAARVLRDYKLVENEHARPGRPLYERFARCWRAAADKRVRLVFHGTPEHNVENICRTGLDPARRSGQAHGRGEYFGGDAAVSLGYCQGGCKMLVFAVMLDASGLTADLRQHNIVVINKPEHQLPLFVLGFENPQRAAQEAARAAAAAAAARQRKVARRRRAQQQSFVSALARGIQARAGNGR